MSLTKNLEKTYHPMSHVSVCMAQKIEFEV